MEKLSVGTTYYVPEHHHLVQVRGIEGDLVTTSHGCAYYADAKRSKGATVCTASETQGWMPVLDPSKHPFLEKDEVGWRVVKDEIINMSDMQAALHSLVTTLKKVGGIGDIYLFGSVARSGTGNDIDIIATVSDEIFSRWTSNVLTEIHRVSSTREDDSLYFNATLRMLCAAELLDFDYEDFEFLFENVTSSKGYPISVTIVYTDIFLFPHNWQERLEQLQNTLPHSDPEFMYKIARDAKLL